MAASLEIPDLVRVLKGVDAAVFLVPARVLRRVIKQDRQIGGFGLFVPHRKSYVIAREPLLHIVDIHELGVASASELPSHLILLASPEPDRLAQITREQALVKYWRMLFHARLDLAMEQKIADGTLNAAAVRQRIQRLGATEFDEIAFVMRQENYLLPPDTPQAIYAEFVAVYLTLRRFASRLVPHFFPCLRDLQAIDDLVAEDIDADAVYSATRLPGSPEPQVIPPRVTQADGLKNPAAAAAAPINAPVVGDKTQRRLDARADIMDARGNNVRAAILRTRAAQGSNLTLARARGELGRLSQRLQKALELSDVETERWRNSMLPLLPRSARRWWSQEARFLYDLQKVCVDSERGIFAVDLVEWAISLGKRPIRRPLPRHQEVVVVRHLRKAMERMRYLRIANGDRQELSALLHHAVEKRERLLRERFRPIITASLDEVGLTPHNVPEELGRAKLTEELLDRVVDYGHINIGNLRDTISQNQLKLPDLKGPVELVTGDPLIRLNRKLAVELDGVYRRGEIYMRMLHRLSSVAFGTVLGRLMVLFLILPFGLAFFVMVTPGLLVEEGEKIAQWIGVMEKPPVEHKGKKLEAEQNPDDTSPEEQPLAKKDGEPQPKRSGSSRHTFPMPNLYGVFGFGVFFLLLFHVTTFRSGVFYGVGRLGRGLQTVLIHGPLWLFQMPVLQAFLHNRVLLFLRRFVFWPLAMAATAGFVAWSNDLEPEAVGGIAGGFFAVTALVINTRLGRDLEETLTDWLAQLWLWLTTDFVPGFLRLIMDVSRWCLEAVEQVLYTVNEWLRFRGGENRIVIGVKAVLSLFWFGVTYVVRFAINLLIEPQINPIKHFPVVTVSHKICLPMIPVLRTFFIDRFGIARARATGLATGIIFGIPGIFGFAVWELKENWKLYSSNRSRNLKPLHIGSHGETMLRLLTPGFHSGTVPKVFRKLRRATRHGQQRNSRKIQAALHHVEECVSHFVERELVALLRQSKGWGGLPIELGKVHLATNRISVELQCPKLEEEPLELAFDQQSGWLLAGVLHPGWLAKLTRDQRQTLSMALIGLYKMAGVNLTREQIAEGLSPTRAAIDIIDDGLVVWPGPDFSKEAIYDLSAGPVLMPQPTNGALPPGLLRPLDTEQVLFKNLPVSWHDWTRTWDRDQSLVNGERREWAYAVLP